MSEEQPPPRRSTVSLGRLGEAAAADHLARHGLEIVARNVVSGGVELDIIARTRAPGDVGVYVFVEVRARDCLERGLPIETVDRRKRRRLVHGASCWLVEQHLWERVEVRFDVCGVELGEELVVNWVRGAFDADDR